MGFIFSSGSRVNKAKPIATSLRIQSSVQGQPIPFVHGQQRIANNLIWYGNFNYTSGSGGGKGGKGGGGGGKGGTGQGASYSASFATALCEGPVDAVNYLWNNKTPESLSGQGMSLFTGYQGQTAWGYLSGTPEGLGYSSLAYVAAANYNLGNQPDLPNFNFEVRGAIANAVTETYTIASGSSYSFTPSYFNLSDSAIEPIAIPASPYQYQAQNPLASTSLPVIIGNIGGTYRGAARYIPGTDCAGVVDTGGTVFTRVSSPSSTHQYSVTSGGLYTFYSGDEGLEVYIIDLAVSPGVNYIYQPTGTTTLNSTSITSVSSTSGLADGQLVTGAGIPPGSVITKISGSTVTISQAATAGASGVTLTAWGAALTQIQNAPISAGQFTVSVGGSNYGLYTFSSADNGKKVGIIDVCDADPSQSLTDYLTNPRYGIGFPAANLGDLTELQEYTFANGLFISPAFTQQTSGQTYFKDFAEGLNGEFVWSGGLLTWKAYGDSNLTGYGKTYTAPSAAIYSLGDDDFLKNEGTSSVGVSAFTHDDPVICARTRQSDAYNDVKVEYLDRGNSYNPAIIEAQDDASINVFGLRPADTKSLHFFCSAAAALTSAQLQLGRQSIRNQYSFTVPWYFILLDPMDIIEITDVNLGLNNTWVRILEITENQQDMSLTITAEEFLGGTGTVPLYGTQVKAGYAPNYNSDPGQAIAPIIFEAPVQIATNNGLEAWLVTGGGSNWGGADVYLSTDNQTYRLVGRYQGSSRLGVNNTDFPTGSDPDTTDTLQVVLATSGELYSATSQSDADLGHTLCYEGGYPNPPAPTLSSSSGGSLSAEDYYVRITYVFSGGEGPPSPEDSLSIAVNNLLVVQSPVAQTGATGWNVYVGTSTGAETQQNASMLTIGDDWTEPTGGLTTGGNPPASATSYELIAYETASLVSGTEYNLGTYIRRGLYGTTISDHPAGSQFARLDGSQVTFPYDKSQIGKTIYIKLLSFNLWGGAEYELDAVQPFQHVIEGPPLPGTVQNYTAQQNGGVVVFGWTDLTDYAVKGYDILYGAQGGSVDTATLLTEAARATEMTNASVPPGSWTFYIRGHDIADQLGPVSSVDLTVMNESDIISQVTQSPDWLGTLHNFVLHYTGILIPASQYDAGEWGGFAYDQSLLGFTPTTGSTAGGSIGATTYYVKLTYVDAYGESTPSNEATQAVALAHLLTVTSPATPSPAAGYVNAPTAYNVYVGTSSGAETLQNATPIPFGSNWTEPVSGLITGAALPSLDTTGWDVFDDFVPMPVSSAYYTAPTVDTGYNANLRVYSTMSDALGAGQTGVDQALELVIDTWLTGQSDPATYTPWTIGFVEMRYLNARLLYSGITDGNVAYITGFEPTIDTAPAIENSSAGGVVISAGGTAITFPTQYHEDPNVVCTVVGSTALYATAVSVTTTGFTAHVWDHTGTDVGGTINWQSTGV